MTAATSIEYAVEEITPERAAGLLERVYGDRSPSEAAVAKYAEVMRAGGWVFNGMPVILDRHERVLDGVNRLSACVEAGKPFRTLFARNVNPDTLHTIDQHRRRTYKQILEAHGFEGAVFDALGKVIRLENGVFGLTRGGISWVRYDATVDAPMPGVPGETVGEALQKAVSDARGLVGDGRTLNTLPHKHRPFFLFMARAAGVETEAKRFLSNLSAAEAFKAGKEAPDFEEIRETPRGDLVEELAGQTRFARKKGEAVDADFQLGRTIQAFEAWRAEESLPDPWARDDDKENGGLPTIRGYPGVPEAKFSGGSAGFKGRTADQLIEAAGAEAPSDDVVTTVTIDADTAKAWLDKFNKGNRALQKSQLEGIARDIASKRWMVNAQPVSFHGDPSAPDARLLNGQHRLKGVIRAQELLDKEGGGRVEIEVPVVTGVSEAAFATYDVQEKRAAGAGSDTRKGDPRVMRAAAKHLARLEREIDVRSALIAEGLKRSDANVHRMGELLTEAADKFNAAGGEASDDPGADCAARLIARPVHFSEAYRQRFPISAGEVQAVIDDYDEGGDLGQAALEARHGQLEREVCSAGVGAALIALLRRRTYPVSAADNFIELLKHGEGGGYTKKNDPLFRKTTRAKGHDGREVMTLSDLKFANVGTGDAAPFTIREQITELLRTWQAHADFMGGIQTGLWWPPRDLEDFDVPEKGLKRKRLDAALARLRGDDEAEKPDAEARKAERDLLDREYDDGRPSDDQLLLTDLDLPE